MSTLPKPYTRLNADQLDAVHHGEGAALILAGAGSGKTQVLTLRILKLIEQGVPPNKILALTFTNKAAKEMSERIAQHSVFGVHISTFHSLGYTILREIYPSIYGTAPILVDELDAKKILKQVLEEHPLIKQEHSVNTLRSYISKCKNALMTPDKCLENTKERSERSLATVYASYDALLKKNQSVDFDDLIFECVSLLEKHPTWKARLQDRFSYLLIDEYQDTNHAQFKLSSILAEKHGNLFAVGDPDQSIYSWRGADIQNILCFERHFPKARIYRLEQNYRSSPEILEAANHLISHNEKRYDKSLWTSKKEGEKIFRYSAEDSFDEANFVADEVLYWAQERNLPLSSIAILYRTNAQSQAFETIFLERSLPYRIVGSLSFYERREIKDLMSFLRVLIFPRDSLALARALGALQAGLGQTTLNRLMTLHQNNSISTLSLCQAVLQGREGFSLRLQKRQKEALETFAQTIQVLMELVEQAPLTEIIKKTMSLFHIENLLAKDPESKQERLENLNALIEKAKYFENNAPQASLELFLSSLSLNGTETENQKQEGVSLMSLHHAKGLEFPLVFLVGLEEALLPHANALNSPHNLEEERRLCYVGMTRAQEYLYLTHAQYRTIWGEERRMLRSRFLKEIPHTLTQKVEWVVD